MKPLASHFNQRRIVLLMQVMAFSLRGTYAFANIQLSRRGHSLCDGGGELGYSRDSIQSWGARPGWQGRWLPTGHRLDRAASGRAGNGKTRRFGHDNL